MDFIQSFFISDFGYALLRFALCMLVNWVIIDRLYFKKSRRRDFYFTFMLMSVAIFFLACLVYSVSCAIVLTRCLYVK